MTEPEIELAFDAPTMTTAIELDIPTFRKGLRIGYININSLRGPKIDEIRIFLTETKLLALCCAETKLDSTVTDSCLEIPAYRFARTDRACRDYDGIGGGLLTFVGNGFEYSIVSLTTLAPNYVEATCIEVTKTKTKS